MVKRLDELILLGLAPRRDLILIHLSHSLLEAGKLCLRPRCTGALGELPFSRSVSCTVHTLAPSREGWRIEVG